MPKTATVEDLLKSGAHFGHLTRRWNPKMKEFIFMQRNGIHIIDLNKTYELLKESLEEITNLARAGKTILFVGTKKQAQDILKTEAIRCGMPFVAHRWLGGMLTNFSTVRKSISRMEEIERMSKDGTFEELTKKEGLMLEREKIKLEQTLGGISNMSRLPGAIFVIDTIKEHIAVNEAVKLNIPIVAMVDTNSDPDIPDFIIPCNDDSARTIQLITMLVADAIIEGASEREAMQEEELMEQAAAEVKAEGEATETAETGKSTRRRKRRRKEDTADGSADEGSDEESAETELTPEEGEGESKKSKDAPAKEESETSGDSEKKTAKASAESGDDDANKSDDSSGEEDK